MNSKNKNISLKMHDIKPTWEGNRFALRKNEKIEKKEFVEKKIQQREITKIQKQEQYFPKIKKTKNDFDFSKTKKRIFLSFKIAIVLIFLFFSFNFVKSGLWIKNQGISSSEIAVSQLLAGKESMRRGDFAKAHFQFNDSYQKLDQVSKNFSKMGNVLVGLIRYVPFISKISSGKNLVLAGKDFSEIGILISKSAQTIEKLSTKGGSENNQNASISYLELFKENKENLDKVAELLSDAQKNLENVNIDDIPKNEKDKVIEIKNRLPEINLALKEFLKNDKLIVDILGGNGPRKYLFLLQNNQEMRATGGFIGSYGMLDIFNGRVRKFFIDGIFNPDGQLKEKVVPPIPIQKISAAWSLHDSNWFPDFPKSAEKATWFYEKTGGPTVDGVITITPTVMQKLLEVIGPVELEEYGMVLDKDNFIEKIQQEVEIDYDKELNQPKKILADATPKILDKILAMENFSDISKIANVFLRSLNEKHILMYSKNKDVENFLSENGWSGEILETEKDYLSVINTNINGFKTDGVVSENISHAVEIQEDGTVIDTLTIKREHKGGDSAYDWWNKVNADYMRVYVPMGSKLLSAEGQTREFNVPPLDYSALKFKRDEDVEAEENSIEIDENSGTKVYEDSGKTVFANWVYVSPKETVTVKYVYVLPFKIEFGTRKNSATYSLLAQKQSGSFGSDFDFKISYPKTYKILWQYPEENNFIKTDLKTNKFFGLAFTDS